MPITVTDLIIDSYYDSSVVARQFEQLQGYQLNDGLKWLNQILGDKAMDSGDIPYITQQYPLTGIVGQETYFVPGLIDIESMVFYVGTVRYQMGYVSRVKYFSQPRANNINSLPVSYTYERVFGGAMVWVYFWPDRPYTFNITGNFFMPPVSLNQDLTLQTANANLGQMTASGTSILTAGQLVINGVDMAGTYGSTTPATNLITAINNQVPFMTASIQGNNQFTLASSLVGAPITISTLGTADTNTASGNLGTISFLGTGTLTAGQLVINGIDLAGTYGITQTATNLIAAINSLVPFVTASVVGGNFTLTRTQMGANIVVTSLGTNSNTNYVSFSGFNTFGGIALNTTFYPNYITFPYFNTIGGTPLNQTYFAQAFDQFYIDYMEYQLAERICQKLNFDVPPGVALQLARYQSQIVNLAEPMDLTMQKLSTMTDARAINYAQVNIGRAFSVSSI